jgi:hypothetical protein
MFRYSVDRRVGHGYTARLCQAAGRSRLLMTAAIVVWPSIFRGLICPLATRLKQDQRRVLGSQPWVFTRRRGMSADDRMVWGRPAGAESIARDRRIVSEWRPGVRNWGRRVNRRPYFRPLVRAELVRTSRAKLRNRPPPSSFRPPAS